jgi:branched-subunit amino acid aminotransferase/4-amino-4-deoxychorismate lyase
VRTVWLDGGLVDPAAAALPIDDPGVRWGEGLFETMRAERGRVALLERHLDRLLGSAAALGLAPVPTRGEMRAAVRAVLAAAGAGPLRVRLTATARPTLLVEAAPEAPLPQEPPAVAASARSGAWLPGDRMAEHKTLSYARHRRAQRAAEAAGAAHALLLDDAGRIGEAALASVLCAVDGELVTAPARGLLPGIARDVVAEALPVREELLPAALWRGAEEIVVVNAVRGAAAVTAVDGRPVGAGIAGPWARRAQDALRAALAPGR